MCILLDSIDINVTRNGRQSVQMNTVQVVITTRWKKATDEQGDGGATMSSLNFGKSQGIGVKVVVSMLVVSRCVG